MKRPRIIHDKEIGKMSQRQEEARELAQQEMYAELRVRSQPLRDEIKELEVE